MGVRPSRSFCILPALAAADSRGWRILRCLHVPHLRRAGVWTSTHFRLTNAQPWCHSPWRSGRERLCVLAEGQVLSGFRYVLVQLFWPWLGPCLVGPSDSAAAVHDQQ